MKEKEGRIYREIHVQTKPEETVKSNPRIKEGITRNKTYEHHVRNESRHTAN